MFERFSEQSRQVLVCAVARARELRHDHIGTTHVLLGILDAGTEAGRLIGAPAEDVIAQLTAGDTTDAGHLPFTPRLKEALEAAARQFLATGDESLNPTHLLLGLIGVPESGAVRALGALGVDLPELRRALLATTAPAPEGATLPDLPAGPRLPGRAALLRWCAVLLIGYAALVVPLVLLARDTGLVPVAVFGAVAPPVIVAVVAVGLFPYRLRRARRLATGRGAATRLPGAAIEAALAPTGVRAVEVYVPQTGTVRDRAYAIGRVGVIVLSPFTLSRRMRPVAGFVLAHEAGHVARRDGIRIPLALAMAEGLVLAGLCTGRPIVAAVAVLVAVLGGAGVRWVNELSCDAIAVRWVGPAAAEAWGAGIQAVRRARPRRRYLRRAFAWTHHPPLALRVWTWRRVR